MRRKRIFFILLCTLVRLVRAEDLQTSNELNKVESDINEVKQNIQRLSQQRDTLQGLLEDIENRYGKTAALLKTLQTQIDQKRESLE